jgi:hypothetical protein
MRADGLNSMLVKEHDFRFTIGAETHLFVVEELVAILPSWPERFRLRLAASADCESKIFYGASAQEAARKAADFVSGCESKKRTDKSAYSSLSRPSPPRQILLPQQIQESESD